MQTFEMETERNAEPERIKVAFPSTGIVVIAAWFGSLIGIFEILIGLRFYRKVLILNLN